MEFHLYVVAKTPQTFAALTTKHLNVNQLLILSAVRMDTMTAMEIVTQMLFHAVIMEKSTAQLKVENVLLTTAAVLMLKNAVKQDKPVNQQEIHAVLLINKTAMVFVSLTPIHAAHQTKKFVITLVHV